MATTNENGLILVNGKMNVALPDELAQKLEEMEALWTDTETLTKLAQAGEVTDEASFIRFGEMVNTNKSNMRTAEALLEPYEVVVKRAKDFLQKARLRVTNNGELLRGILNRKMGDYTRRKEEEERREAARIAAEKKQKADAEAAEQRRLDEEAAKARREIRVREIREDLKAKRITKREAEKLLREAGAIEEADKAQAAADEDDAKTRGAKVAESTVMKSSVPKVTGVVRRTNYKAVCVDPDLFLQAFINEYIGRGRQFGDLRRFVTVSDQALGEEARTVKDSLKMQETYPGVMASDEKTF